jgi:hypothetical protein
MSRSIVNPDTVKTLKNWTDRWPKSANIQFDAETREPVVFSVDGKSIVKRFPYKREGDVINILSNTQRFSPRAVEIAKKRYSDFKDQQKVSRADIEGQIRIQEGVLLDEWRRYHAAPEAMRGTMRRDILTAERTLNQLEKERAKNVYVDRKGSAMFAVSVYHAPLPSAIRSIPIAEGTE